MCQLIDADIYVLNRDYKMNESPVSSEKPVHRLRSEGELLQIHIRLFFAIITRNKALLPPLRQPIAVWILLEVLAASMYRPSLTQKDLVGLLLGIVSEPTISRVVNDMRGYGLLTTVQNARHARSAYLVPGPVARQLRGLPSFLPPAVVIPPSAIAC